MTQYSNGLPKRRLIRHDGWTAPRCDLFFGSLALTANVRASCALVGLDPSGAYAKRKRDPEFRARWDEAMVDARGELARLMLERALIAETHLRSALDGSDEDARKLALMRAFPDRVAELLFRAHLSAGEPPSECESANDEEALARIERRLDALRASRLRSTRAESASTTSRGAARGETRP